MTIEEAFERQRLHVEEVQRLYPDRKTACGALLADILSDRDMSERDRSVHIFGVRKYRRGLKQLEGLIATLLPTEEWNENQCWTPESKFLHTIFLTLGWMDTAASHAVLIRLLQESPSPRVRGDILEGMAYETEQFDVKLVLPFATEKAFMPELLSAIYALMCQDYVNKKPKACLEVVEPLLKHPYCMVRVYVIDLLERRPKCRALIQSLADDPELVVRQGVANALKQMDDWG